MTAMTSISLHELNQRSGHIVRTAASTGKTVTITDHNRPIARIVPISCPNSRMQQLVAAGILSHAPEPYSPPTTTAPQPNNTDFLPSKNNVVSLLDREDRL